MKTNKILILPILCFSLTFFVLSCSSEDSDSGSNNADSFNRQTMLVNWADNLIIPAYQEFDANLNVLQTAVSTFETAPSEINLDAIRTAWETAYLSWQNVAMFRIGPAETLFYRRFMNTYPVNANTVEANIASGSYALQDINLDDAQGFPALDYLLFGLAENDTDVLAFYTTNPNASAYLSYLSDVVDRMKSLTTEVLSEWEGNFRNSFVSNNGSSANSSTNRLVNEYLEYYELNFRNGKIGIPAGVFSAGASSPERVEAFYKRDISKDLCMEALNAIRRFFNGTAFIGTAQGESLKSYLDFLNTMKQGEDLSQLINSRFDASMASVSNLDNNFFNQINTNNNAMLQSFEALQSTVVLLKTDMMSALSIDVEFDSGDGD